MPPRASTNLSLRGLQAGGVTTLVIEGSELLPDPRIFLSAPVARQTIKDGATPQRLEVEFLLDGQTPAGIYLLRVASASGISDAVALGVDNLPQIPFAPQVPRLERGHDRRARRQHGAVDVAGRQEGPARAGRSRKPALGRESRIR